MLIAVVSRSTATSWACNFNCQFASAPGQLPVYLTNSSTFMRGSAFWGGKVLTDAFVWRSTIKIDQVVATGADGMALVLHNDPRGPFAVGAAGSGLGYSTYSGIGGIINSIAVSLHTDVSAWGCDTLDVLQVTGKALNDWALLDFTIL